MESKYRQSTCWMGNFRRCVSGLPSSLIKKFIPRQGYMYSQLKRFFLSRGFFHAQYSGYTADPVLAINAFIAMVQIRVIHPPSRIATTLWHMYRILRFVIKHCLSSWVVFMHLSSKAQLPLARQCRLSTRLLSGESWFLPLLLSL
ncbi:hypothetical protein BDV98DRAFT_298150 [Pterulicium gracile]|uniref:Uncharacterized protein n=1 Tax=Pterulicium gracile TaxID=1884261 RepID=A0A5C3Q7C0_9AGAR|nr:hypothetical protein BDV98DRAFT_298150 [Pterula gracilis]